MKAGCILSVVDCGPPDVVPNGNVIYNTTTYSSQGQIVCNPGFNLSDVNDTISCTANGTWDVLLGSCQAVDCGIPGPVHNGISLYNSTTYGSLCYLVCNPGFTGLNETITCRADGTWENVTASCEAVDCGTPALVHNGISLYNSTTYGSLCYLICNSGFTGLNETITCRADGTWENVTASCEAVNCGSPAATPFGSFNYSSTTHDGTDRRFYINNFFKSCPGDTGWMLIKDKADYNPCSWEKNVDLPAIMFSKSTTATLSGDFEFAHVMAVLAKVKEAATANLQKD
ncbi:P-selectin-like [Haliotis asinina]|uniref:P-selectin-like n=1 Tax=Haliotis asinina TaxID=109174 RepID=UPI003531C055